MPMSTAEKFIPTINENRFSLSKEYLKNCDLIIDYGNENHPRRDLHFFPNAFSSKVISDDSYRVKQIKASFNKINSISNPDYIEWIKNGKKISEALEIIITDQIKFGNWFGNYSLPFRTTEYDDLVNGVDIVAKFDIERNNHQERFYLSIDSTSYTNSDRISEKINRNISKLLSNNFEVKYYESPTPGKNNFYRGRLKNTIPVIIGLDSAHTAELINQFSNFISLQRIIKDNSPQLDNEHLFVYQEEFKQLKHKLETNPCQLIFLKEINCQLNMYSRILAKENDSEIKLRIPTIGKLKKVINGVIQEKEDIINSPETENFKNTDTVYRLICCPLQR